MLKCLPSWVGTMELKSLKFDDNPLGGVPPSIAKSGNKKKLIEYLREMKTQAQWAIMKLMVVRLLDSINLQINLASSWAQKELAKHRSYELFKEEIFLPLFQQMGSTLLM